MRMNRLIACACTLVSLAASATMADVITQDTYIDSYPGTTTVPKNTDLNSGGAAAIKVVTSPGSTEFPFSTSIVRTLIKLPDSFWSSIGTSNVAQANVTFRVRTFNNGLPFDRVIGAYPLKHDFKVGNGFTPTTPGGTKPDTKGGTQNTPANPVGVDWNTYDGVNAWSTPGLQAGTEYDAAAGHFVIGAINTVGVTTVSWNLRDLINDPTTRAEIKTNGLLFKITDDLENPPPPPPSTDSVQRFISFYSYQGANLQTDPSAFYPQATFVVPEPTTLCAAGAAFALLARRPRKAAR